MAALTEYIVFRASAEEGHWIAITRVQAASSPAAVRQVASASGTYVAVPARSFQEIKVEVETQPRVRFVN